MCAHSTSTYYMDIRRSIHNIRICMYLYTVDPSIPDTLGPVQWTPLFRTPWDQYSGPLYSGHFGTSTVDPSIPDTLGPVQWTPLFWTPWDQYSGPLYCGHLGTSTVDPSIPDTLGPVQRTPLFRTPWDQYSGPLYSGHLGTSTVDPSIPDTLGPVQWTPLFRTAWDQEWLSLLLRCPHFRGRRCTVAYCSGIFGSSGMCPYKRGFAIRWLESMRDRSCKLQGNLSNPTLNGP